MKEVEKATSGRVKFHMLAQHPSAASGTFDAVRDGLVDVSFVTASYTPARLAASVARVAGRGTTRRDLSMAFAHLLETLRPRQ